MKLKRDLVKYVRDKDKSKYKKANHCYICGSTDELDFHHYYGLTDLLEKWINDKELDVQTEQDILNIREEFIRENKEQIFDEAVTLCHKHHLRLHSVYGKKPKLIHAQKMKRWVEIQREKHGLV